MNQHIEEKYQVISAVNLGGAYRMYVAEHREEHTRWAIREIRRTDDGGDTLRRAQEIQAMEDPLLPQIREIYEDEELISTVEEYIPGVSLRAYVEQSGAMDEADVAAWMSDLAGFLHRLHDRGIILGDLDPSDLRLMPDNSVRVADYSALCGLQRGDGEEEYGFHAPEQRNGGAVGPWTDVYALGAVAYYALTGKDPDEPPHRYYPLRHYNAAASAGMEYILNKCLQPNPRIRYRNTAELLYDLQHIGRFNKVMGRYKRKKFLRGLAVALLLVAGGGLMLYGYLTNAEEQRDNYRVLLNNAAALADDGEYEAAFQRLTEAQAVFPDDVRAYEKWSDFLYSEGAYAQCAEYCTRQLSSFPESKVLVLNLAMSDYALGEYRMASEYFHLAGEESMDLDQLFRYVLCLIRLDRVDEAGTIYNKYSNRWDYGRSYYIQGELYVARGELAEAAAALQGALGESTEDALRQASIRLLAQVYLRAAQAEDSGIEEPLAKAEALLESALAEREDAALRALYGQVLFAGAAGEGEYLAAAGHIAAAIAAGEGSEENYLLLIRAYAAGGDTEAAVAAALEAEEKYQSAWRIRAAVAWVEIAAQERRPAAERDYAAAYGEYTMAESLLGNEEPDELLLALREKIEDLRSAGLVAD